LDHSESEHLRFLDATCVTERLPFTVRIARSDEDLAKAVSIRHSAYSRHLPRLAYKLKEPEAYDQDPSCVVFLAESRLDGSPLGTIRVHSARSGRLPLEQSVDLPQWLKSQSRAEATRLGVIDAGVGRVVKHVLFKAYFSYCLLAGIDWLVIAARPPLDRQYRSLLFHDLFEDHRPVPMHHAGGIAHHVLAFEVRTAEARWAEAQHPLYDFIVRTHHPDLAISPPLDQHGERAAQRPSEAYPGSAMRVSRPFRQAA
jgi:hypothetical protein